MVEELKQHYRSLLREFGNSHQAVQHRDLTSQRQRFRVLADMIDRARCSLIDVGCGLGHFSEFLREQRFTGPYLGLDMLPEFIREAQESFGGAKTEFRVCDVRTDPVPSGYDFVMSCGMFNNKLEDNKAFMLQAIAKMFAAAKRGIAFNALSTYVDYQAADLYYSDPLEVFDFCKTHLSRKVILRHEYLVRKGTIPYEYTMYVYK
jgi:2-polyprenyl-3-methyl-5-hydroxy-6-metoxy-1,4-benzoquinol methylase